MIKLLAIGNLGKDAELKNVNNKNVIEFSIAHTDKFNSSGIEQSRTTWINCSYWTEKTGILPYLKKGTQVYVEGAPSSNAYTNKEGKSVGDLRLRVSSVQLLGSKGSSGVGHDHNTSNDFNTHNQEKANYDDVSDDLPF